MSDATPTPKSKHSVSPVVFAVIPLATALAPNLTFSTRFAIIVGAYVYLWILVRLRRPRGRPAPDVSPSPEYLERLDASVERERQQDHVASGEGAREYERVLGDLLGLAGREVTVVVGSAAGGCWRPLARLTGRLRGAHPTHVRDEPERMAFSVGSSGVFYLDRDRFERGLAAYRRCEDGALSIEDRDGDSFRLSRVTRATDSDHVRRH